MVALSRKCFSKNCSARAAKRDARKVLATSNECYFEVKDDARLASELASEVNFVGSRALQSRVRAMLVIPIEE